MITQFFKLRLVLALGLELETGWIGVFIIFHGREVCVSWNLTGEKGEVGGARSDTSTLRNLTDNKLEQDTDSDPQLCVTSGRVGREDGGHHRSLESTHVP